MNFASDNTAPVAPAILDAIVEANNDFAAGYGDDDWTRSVERRLSELFEREVAAFLVPTGTAANALALAQVTPPAGGRVLSCRGAHRHRRVRRAGIFRRRLEALRPCRGRRQNHAACAQGGAILLWRPQAASDDRFGALADPGDRSRHHLSHRGDRRALRHRACALACRARGRRALRQCAGAAQRDTGAGDLAGGDRRAVVWRHQRRRACGGGGGLNSERAALFGERRKRGGHLLSKHRFTAAQFAAYLANDRWLALARHANAMADRLAEKLTAKGLAPVWPIEANLVFVALSRALDAKLKAAGAHYYVRRSESLPLGADQVLARFVTSFATKEEEIDQFVSLCGRA